MELFDIKYETKTSKGETNFIGAVRTYFDIYTKNVLPKTKEEYIRRYNETIFPVVDISKAVHQYNDDEIQELLKMIYETSGYSKESIKTNIEHLVFNPIEHYFSDPINKVDHEALWGSKFKFEKSYKNESEIKSAILLLKKSLSIPEEKKLDSILFCPETDNGALMGLALMLYMGLRNNEACGLEFRHIKALKDYPNSYYAQVFQTTQLYSNKLKLGGKTYNAPRQLPILIRLMDLIEKRKDYINSCIKFPYIDEFGKTFNSVEELPIACRSTKFTARCNSNDLTVAGRNILRNELKVNENEVSGLSYVISSDKDTEYDLGEKDPTTYLLRRNFGTHLYTLGFSTNDSQYYMGHTLDGIPLSRVDYADESYLHGLWLKLQQHPLNKEHLNKQHIDLELMNNTMYSVSIKGKEINDEISIKLSNNATIKMINEVHANKKFEYEVDIVSQVQRAYND